MTQQTMMTNDDQNPCGHTAWLNRVVYILPLNPDRTQVGAFRLIDLAASMECMPDDFRNRMLEKSPWDLLGEVQQKTNPLFTLERSDYEYAVEAMQEQANAHDLVSYTGWDIDRDYTQACKQRIARLAAVQPGLVMDITIEGSELRDMYDEHPGLAYFTSSTSRGVEIQKPLLLAEAMTVAMAAWNEVARREDGNEPGAEDSEYDGQFTAERIVLLNVAREVVQQYNGHEWITEFAPSDEWDSLLGRAKALDAEAAEESRWDNFSTSGRYRDQARDLRRQVSMARANLGFVAEGAPSAPSTQARLEPAVNTERADSPSLDF